MPGPTDWTSVSVVNAPPDVQKYSMNTSESVVIARTSGMRPKVPRSRGPGNAHHATRASPERAMHTSLPKLPTSRALVALALLVPCHATVAHAQDAPAVAV